MQPSLFFVLIIWQGMQEFLDLSVTFLWAEVQAEKQHLQSSYLRITTRKFHLLIGGKVRNKPF